MRDAADTLALVGLAYAILVLALCGAALAYNAGEWLLRSIAKLIR